MPAAFVAPPAARVEWSADFAVTELYELHYRALVRLAALVVRDTPTAEEVVQDAFVAMHGGWRPSETPRTRWPTCGRRW